MIVPVLNKGVAVNSKNEDGEQAAVFGLVLRSVPN